MRVLHVQKVKGIGGSERHLLALLPALADRGIEVRMCVLAEGAAERFMGPLRDTGIPVTAIPAGPDVNPRLVARLVREIRSSGPDVVHTHLIHADVHGQTAARIAGVPAVSSMHSTNTFYRRRPVKTVARLAGRMARRTIAISDHVRSFLVQQGLARGEDIRVIPYGIDPARWELARPQREAARARLGIRPGQVVIGVASRLVPFKGHDFLIDAVGRAEPRARGLRLLVAGDGTLREELEERARRRVSPGVVGFLGHVSDVESFMNACDILAFPTVPGIGEGFGLAALEGMAAGRPVVASAVYSLPEIVVNGETGYLVPPWGIEELASALVRLASDAKLRSRLGARARDRAATAFSLEAMVERTTAVYREVTDRHPGAHDRARPDVSEIMLP
jgi:glycosyltransferase involved in cell wall biosynthesis